MNRFAEDVLGCQIPLLMAPIAHLASTELIAAVTNAGGIGTFPLHQLKAQQTDDALKRIRILTDGPILIAFTGEWERDENLDVLVAHGITLAMVFWWNGPRLTRKLQSHGVKVGWQVGTDDQLNDAISSNADFIIAQGLDAGGHVRSPHPLPTLLELIRRRTNTPVVAAGGINMPEHAAHLVPKMAAGVMLGTRFSLSAEANSTMVDKQLLCDANDESVMLDTTLRGDWPCAFRRRITSGGNKDIPERYANANIREVSEILPAAKIVDNFSRILTA